tara:strand:- start:652 stop:1557 length:906 start_codon:yes stop_codon:yes gene_type:complete
MVLGLLWGGNAYAQIFYPNKDIDLDKFFNFDISNYSFEDYEKILGKNSQKWDGDPDKKGRNELDHRKISIKSDGRKHELKLRKIKKKGIKLYLTLNGYTCDEAQKLVPEKYIKKENYYNYYSDFVIMKMQSVDFSFDIGESRVSFSCMGMVSPSGEAKKVDYIFLIISPKKTSSKVLALKPITCSLDRAKTNINNKWADMEGENYLNFYLKDHKKYLLDKNYNFTGDTIKYSKDFILTKKTYKNKRASKQRISDEYKVDRINGGFAYIKKNFDPNATMVKDNIIIVEYSGKCKKRTEERKF